MSIAFDEWIARVEQELGTEGIEPEAYRQSHQEGMSPGEAVLKERLAAGLLEAEPQDHKMDGL